MRLHRRKRNGISLLIAITNPGGGVILRINAGICIFPQWHHRDGDAVEDLVEHIIAGYIVRQCLVRKH